MSGFSRSELQGYLDLFVFMMNPPHDKLEKVRILLEKAIITKKTLKYRDYFAKNDWYINKIYAHCANRDSFHLYCDNKIEQYDLKDINQYDALIFDMQKVSPHSNLFKTETW